MSRHNKYPTNPSKKARKAIPRVARVSGIPPAQDEPKALRIGLIQAGRIVEERIFRRREHVSCGQSARSTFVIAHPCLPAHHVLFESRKGEYTLRTEPFMGGRLTAREKVVDLASLGAVHVPLDDASRGRITFGDVTLLFQFVVPPPRQPRPQLPSSVRAAWLREVSALFGREEGFIGMTWSSTLMACIGLVVFFHLNDWPVQPPSYEVYKKWLDPVTVNIEEPRENEIAERNGEAGEGERVDEDTAEGQETRPQKVAKRAPRKPLTEEQKAALDAKRRAMLKAALEKYGIPAVVGSLGGESGEGAGVDLLKGASMSPDFDKLMDSVNGLKPASASDAWSKLDGPAPAAGGEVVELDGMRDAQAADANLASSTATEKKPVAKTNLGPLEEQDSLGILDEKGVIATVRKGLPALRNCYEKGLNRNHALEGKISVEFTIGTSGRVMSVKAKTNSLGDPQVTTCVLGKFKSFKFAKPEGGSVKYVYPLMFKPGN